MSEAREEVDAGGRGNLGIPRKVVHAIALSLGNVEDFILVPLSVYIHRALKQHEMLLNWSFDIRDMVRALCYLQAIANRRALLQVRRSIPQLAIEIH